MHIKICLLALLFVFAAIEAREMYICEDHGRVYGFVEGGVEYRVWQACDDKIEEINHKAVCGICGKVNQNKD